MTIGFAATYLHDGHGAFMLAADARSSLDEEAADVAIKTYTLAARVGVVGAGDALSCATAVEMTRGIVADDLHLNPTRPINFYSMVRLFSHFLDRVEREKSWTKGCEVALAGFLENGMPALAKVITRPGESTRILWASPTQNGSLVMMVGQRDAKAQVSSALRRAFDERQDWTERAAATIWYLCQHQGEAAIGGGIAVAVCPADAPMHWPSVVIDGRIFLRGFDVTDSVSPSDDPRHLHLKYDESWHAEVDQFRIPPAVRQDEGFTGKGYTLEQWVQPADLFVWMVEPDHLKLPPTPSRETAVVIVVLPDELPTQ